MIANDLAAGKDEVRASAFWILLIFLGFASTFFYPFRLHAQGLVINPISDFGCKGDGIADDTACLQAAIDRAANDTASNGKKIIQLSGIFRITSQLKWVNGSPPNPHGISLQGAGAPERTPIAPIVATEGRAMIFYDGPTDSDQAMLLVDATAIAGSIRDVVFFGGRKIGFNLRIKSRSAGTQIAVNTWYFENVAFQNAIVANISYGPYPDPSGTHDVDSANTVFNRVDIYGSPIGVVIDANNAAGITFISPFFWSRKSSLSLQNHLVNAIFQRRGTNNYVYDGVEAGALADHPDRAIFRIEDGNFSVVGGHFEDSPLIRAASPPREWYRSISVSGVRGPTGKESDYSIYSPGNYFVTVQGSQLRGVDTSSKVHVGGTLVMNNVDLGPKGVIELTGSGTATVNGGRNSTTPHLGLVAGSLPGVKIAKGLTDAVAAPTSPSAANSYLHLGGREWGLNSYRVISFGYTTAFQTNVPAYIGFVETASNVLTKGALVFATRDVETDTEPTERMRIHSNGAVQVHGSFFATSKHFQIPHPLEPEKKHLVHSALEGPETAVYYRGESQLINGTVTVTLPPYFEALTRKEQRTVQLTPIGGWAPLYVAGGISRGSFTVRAADDDPGQRFYWEVKAVRADVPPLVVEKVMDEEDKKLIQTH